MLMAFCFVGGAVKASALCDKSSWTLHEEDELEKLSLDGTIDNPNHHP
jgi:hypothetical protein